MRKQVWKTTAAVALAALMAVPSGSVAFASEAEADAPEAQVQEQAAGEEAAQVQEEAAGEEAAEAPDRELSWYNRGDAINVGDNKEWEGVVDNEDNTVVLTGSNTLDWASSKTLEIPAKVGKYTVVGVSGYLDGFSIMSPGVITTVKFPNTVSFIEDGAFSQFTNVTTVYLPDNTGYDGIDAWNNPFSGCTKIETVYANVYSLDHEDLRNSLKTITYYDGVTQINGTPYFGLSTYAELTTINLPASIERFGWGNSPKLSALNCPKPISQIIVTTTQNCPNLRIPVNAGVTAITDAYKNSGITSITLQLPQGGSGNAKDAFINCPNLTGIYVTDPNGEFHSEDGVLWWNDDLYAYPAGKSQAGNYDVPENTKCIYLYAFDSCKFDTITFPENINPSFYFDSTDTIATPRESFLENTGFTKVRLVAGSEVPYSNSAEDLADRLEIAPSQVEFYLGNTYKISYNLDGGTNDPANPTSYRAGEDPVTLKNPTKKGSVFLGWKRNDVADGYENTTQRAYNGYFTDYTFTACWSTDLPYNDVGKETWFYEYVGNVYEKGLMTGLDDTTFGPTANLARAQFAVILYRMNGEPEVTYSAQFPDVADEQWYTDAILWAADTGVVTGYSDTGKFGPSDNINREQMAVMMYRYAKYKGYDTSAQANLNTFPDHASVNVFAKEAMSWCVAEGIITGDKGNLSPQKSANRAECATIITRYLDKVEE